MNQLTEAEKARRNEFMNQIQSEYIEEPIAKQAKDQQLKNFAEALNTRGFNFDPFKVIKAIDAEAEKQFNKLFTDMFNGVKIDRLADIKNEIIAWYNSEEERFAKYRDRRMAEFEAQNAPAPEHMDAHAELPLAEPNDGSPEAEVTPITKAKKGKKK